MKFYGKPNQVVSKHRPNEKIRFKPLFQFDENGVYETSDEKMCELLKKHFKYEEDYNDYTYQELKSIASERGINTYGLNKKQVIESLEQGKRVTKKKEVKFNVSGETE